MAGNLRYSYCKSTLSIFIFLIGGDKYVGKCECC